MAEHHRERLLDDWHARFDYDDAAIDTVERYLRRRYGELSPADQERLWDHLTKVTVDAGSKSGSAAS